MNKLRINCTDIYEIEVNDKGETIQFNLKDVDLPFRFQRAYEGIKQTQTKMKADMVIAEKKSGDKADGALFSERELALAKVRKQAYADMRKAMDGFLGEGGCQKIFGDTDYIDMYDDLFDALNEKGEDGLSHFDRMQMGAEDVKKKIAEKYGNDEDDVLK